MTAPVPAPSGRRAAFRSWRRTRPFWGGLFALVAGAEMYGLTAAPMQVVVVQGVTGVGTLLIAGMLVVLAISAWTQPLLKTIVGFAVVGLSLASLLVSNLGGFGFGAITGVIGGAMIFAWTPYSKPAQSPTAKPPFAGGKGTSLLAAPLLAAAMAAPAAPPAAAPAAAGKTCILWVICVPDSGSGSTTAPSSTPSSAPAGTAPTTAAPTTSSSSGGLLGLPSITLPGVTPSTSAGATPSAKATCSESAFPSAMPALGSSGASSAASALSACTQAEQAQSKATTATAPGGTYSSLVTTIKTPQLALYNPKYDGIVTIQTDQGPLKVLKFRADKLTVNKLNETVPAGNGSTIQLTGAAGETVISGNVTLYVLSLSGNAFGLLPLTFSVQAPPPLTLPYLMFTNATTQAIYVKADALSLPSGTVAI